VSKHKFANVKIFNDRLLHLKKLLLATCLLTLAKITLRLAFFVRHATWKNGGVHAVDWLVQFPEVVPESDIHSGEFCRGREAEGSVRFGA